MRDDEGPYTISYLVGSPAPPLNGDLDKIKCCWSLNWYKSVVFTYQLKNKKTVAICQLTFWIAKFQTGLPQNSLKTALKTKIICSWKILPKEKLSFNKPATTTNKQGFGMQYYFFNRLNSIVKKVKQSLVIRTCTKNLSQEFFCQANNRHTRPESVTSLI